MEERNDRSKSPQNDAPVVPRRLDAWLHVVSGPDTGKKFILKDERTVIGRGEDADFLIDDLTVSRRHAAVELHQEGFYLVDLGSSNGTRLNGSLISNSPFSDEVLDDGAMLELGSTIILFHLGVPEEAPAPVVSIRQSDTQELPLFSSQRAQRSEGSALTPQMRNEQITPTGVERPLVSSRPVSAVISWIVVFALVGGGVALLFNLMEAAGPKSSGERENKTVAEERPVSRVVHIRPRRPPERAQVPVPPPALFASVSEAPDVALERFKEALARESDGDYHRALALLREIQEKYPEFVPPDESSISERIELLEKCIDNAATIRWAEDLLNSDNPDKARLNELLVELGSIPATDGRFGAEAILLADRTRTRLNQLEINERMKKEQPTPTSSASHTKESPDSKQVADPVSHEDPALVDAARAKARAYYVEGAFSKASRELRSAAQLVEEGDKKKLERLARYIDEFSRCYDEARLLASKPGAQEEAINKLEEARSLDARSFQSWSKTIDSTLAELHSTLAVQALEAEDYQTAREHLDKARKLDSSLRSVAKVESLFSFRVASLLRQAREADSPDRALALTRQAVQLSVDGDPSGVEARKLLKKLGHSTPRP